MGARVYFNIKQDNNTWLNLYSHWGETTMYRDLANALSKAQPRWTDTSYGTRIIISQLIGNQWDDEHGFGLTAGFDGIYDESWIDIDMTELTVTDSSGTHSFESFCSYHVSPIDKKQHAVV